MIEFLNNEHGIILQNRINDLNQFDTAKVLSIMRTLHYFLGHPGTSKTYRMGIKIFSRRGLKIITEKMVQNCYYCQKNKDFRSNMGFLSGKCISNKPWEYICSDIFGPIRYTINTENKNDIYIY